MAAAASAHEFPTLALSCCSISAAQRFLFLLFFHIPPCIKVFYKLLLLVASIILSSVSVCVCWGGVLSAQPAMLLRLNSPLVL